MSAAAASDGDGVEVREASGAERQACRMLLPEWTDAMGWSLMLVAVDSASGRITGAAMAMPVRHASGETHLRFIMRVAKPYRGAGVGSAILARMERLAREDAAPALVASGVAEESARFLLRRGFAGSEALRAFELDVESVVRRTIPIAARADRTNRVPAGARIAPIDRAAIPRLAQLHGALIGGSTAALAEAMHARLLDPAWSNSRMMVIDGEPHAFMTARTTGAVGDIEACLVSPGLQACCGSSGWAAPWLFARMCALAHDVGVTTLRFECRDTNRRMITLAGAMRATPAGTRAVMLRRFD